MAEDRCSSQMTTCSFVIAILSVTINILISLSCVYWKLMSRPEAVGEAKIIFKNRQKIQRSGARDHTLFMLQEI